MHDKNGTAGAAYDNGDAEADPSVADVAMPEGARAGTPGGDRVPDVYVSPHLNAIFDLTSAAQVSIDVTVILPVSYCKCKCALQVFVVSRILPIA
jgi:hypothetical protein